MIGFSLGYLIVISTYTKEIGTVNIKHLKNLLNQLDNNVLMRYVGTFSIENS